MKRALLVLPLLPLAACAEEDEGAGSLEMAGVGVAVPWWALLAVLLAAAAVVRLSRRRR